MSNNRRARSSNDSELNSSPPPHSIDNIYGKSWKRVVVADVGKYVLILLNFDEVLSVDGKFTDITNNRANNNQFDFFKRLCLVSPQFFGMDR